MGLYAGIYKGIVCSKRVSRGRVRCQIPEVMGESPSAYCELCWTGTRPSFKVKDTVWVMFENGDVNKPVIVGRSNY